MRMRQVTVLATTIAVLALPAAASGAPAAAPTPAPQSMVLELEGFPNDLPVLAWSWGVSNSGSAHTGGGLGGGKANFQDLSVTRYVDAATPLLVGRVANGAHMDWGVLSIYGDRSGKGTPYLQLCMQGLLVTSLSTGGSPGTSRLTENLTLNYGRIVVVYRDGPTIPAVFSGWDLTENVRWGVVNDCVPPASNSG